MALLSHKQIKRYERAFRWSRWLTKKGWPLLHSSSPGSVRMFLARKMLQVGVQLSNPRLILRLEKVWKERGPYYVAPLIALSISVVSISSVILRDAQRNPHPDWLTNLIGLLVVNQAVNFLFCLMWALGWGARVVHRAPPGKRWEWVYRYEGRLWKVVVLGHGLRFATGFLAWGGISFAYTLLPRTGSGSASTVLSSLFQLNPVFTAAVILIAASLPGNKYGLNRLDKLIRLAVMGVAVLGVAMMFLATPFQLAFAISLGAGFLYAMRPFPQGWLSRKYKVNGAWQMLVYSGVALFLYMLAYAWLAIGNGFHWPDYGGITWVLFVSGAAAVGQQVLSQYAMGQPGVDKSRVAMWGLAATPTTIILAMLFASAGMPAVPIMIGALLCLVSAVFFARLNNKARTQER